MWFVRNCLCSSRSDEEEFDNHAAMRKDLTITQMTQLPSCEIGLKLPFCSDEEEFQDNLF